MNTISLQFMLLVFCLLLIIPAEAFAESEPNDTPGAATPLALNGSDGGTLSYTTDQNDWWVVTTTVDGALYIETNSNASEVDVDLHLYDNGGTNQIASYDISAGNKETTHRNDLLPGTYYIKANYAYGNGNVGGAYTILCTFTPAGLSNDPEFNDSSNVASVLNPNSSSTGHLGYYGEGYEDLTDWWKVTTTFDGSLVVNTISDATVDIDLWMFDQDGKTQIASYDTSDGIHEATHYYNLSPGTYYVKAYCANTGQGSYTISNVYVPTGLVNDSEPNETSGTANTLAPNNSSTGHLGYLSQGAHDANDWWKVTLPDDGTLIVRTYSDATLEIDLWMFDQDGTTQIATYDTSAGRNEATHYNGLKAGTYYIRAYGISSYYYGSYTISSIYTAAKLSNDIESNDALSSAQSISVNTQYNGHIGYFGAAVCDLYDFYTFTLPAQWDTLFLRTDSDPTADIDLILYDNTGSQITSSSASGPIELLIYPTAPAAVYSIRLSAYGYGYSYGSYSIIVSNVRPTLPSAGVKEPGKEAAPTLPEKFALLQNYPNPFNPNTVISYQLSVISDVKLSIYDVIGREIAVLANGRQNAGTYTTRWNAQNFPSGIYFYRLQANSFTQTKKLILLK